MSHEKQLDTCQDTEQFHYAGRSGKSAIQSALARFIDAPGDNNVLKSLNLLPDTAYKFSEANSIQGIITATATSRGIGSIGNAFLERCAANQSTVREFDLEASKLIAPVLAEFNQENLSHTLLKGYDLTRRIYPQPHTRPMGDVDVLIDKNSLHTVLSIFSNQGFRYDRERLSALLVYDHEISVYKDNLEVDLHWDLQEPLSIHKFQIDQMLNERVEVDYGTSNYSGLSLEDLLIHVVFHIEHHLWTSIFGAGTDPFRDGLLFEPSDTSINVIKMIWLYDVILILTKHPYLLESDELARKIKRLGIRKEFVYVLGVCEKVFPEMSAVLTPKIVAFAANTNVQTATNRHRSVHRGIGMARVPILDIKIVRFYQVMRYIWPRSSDLTDVYDSSKGANSFLRIRHLFGATVKVTIMFLRMIRHNVPFSLKKIARNVKKAN